MDLQDFDGQDMYFDKTSSEKVASLLQQAAQAYGEGEAEKPLLRAYFLAPTNLTVLVAMYRFYYYQHRLTDALSIADKAMEVAGNTLGLPGQWQQLCLDHLGEAAMQSMGMLRFYLLALKGAAYLNLRIGNTEVALSMLSKLVELDAHDRLGVAFLYDMARQRAIDEIVEQDDKVVRLAGC